MSQKVVAFNVPQTEQEVVRVQIDDVPHFYDKLHQHPEIQVMLIESGEGTLIAGDYVGRFRAGEVYVIGSKQPHVFRCDAQYYNKSLITRARSISLYFNERYFGRELWESNELSALRQFANDCQQSFSVFSHTVPGMIRSLSKKTGLDRLVDFFSLLREIIATGDKRTLSIQPGQLHINEEGRMSAIVEFTFRESHRKIYLTEIAQLANLSVEAFCRYFKLHTRKTYINFLNEVRISNACQRLIQRDASIQEVCYQTGFSNVSNFNRIFKKVTGRTPQAFRQQLPFTK